MERPSWTSRGRRDRIGKLCRPSLILRARGAAADHVFARGGSHLAEPIGIDDMPPSVPPAAFTLPDGETAHPKLRADQASYGDVMRETPGTRG